MGDGRAVGGSDRSSVVGGLQGCMQVVMDNMVVVVVGGGARGFAPMPPDAGWECQSMHVRHAFSICSRWAIRRGSPVSGLVWAAESFPYRHGAWTGALPLGRGRGWRGIGLPDPRSTPS